MINCNPETVSTDFDISDRLYFESLTLEDVLEVVRIEKPKGVILQFGGQTPLKLASELDMLGVPILGTSSKSIDLAEDREKFDIAMKKIGLETPRAEIAHTVEEAFGRFRRAAVLSRSGSSRYQTFRGPRRCR